jgi:NAD(P)H-dependent FMN reductase
MTSAVKKIGIVICSQRTPRVGPTVAQFVFDTISTHQSTSPDNAQYELNLIDLKDYNLPLFDETIIPAMVPTKATYAHTHTQRWSATVSSTNAFIFVTPQYNWGYPASLKNAIDYLFTEWNGKPGMIVSYGNRGGGRSGEQLRQVLAGVRMRVTEGMPELAFADEQVAWKAMTEGELLLEARERWKAQHTEKIIKTFEELKALLGEEVKPSEH